jgi:UDP-N-acetylglucosamine 2-epimerase (non-hydrolysing)
VRRSRALYYKPSIIVVGLYCSVRLHYGDFICTLVYMNILISFGTRPEYIKVLSLIKNLKNIKTLFTGQHTDLLKNSIKTDYVINIKSSSGNRLNDVMCSILEQSHNVFDDVTHVLVQGDTTSACAVALSAFHHGKKVIHLEAGLRTHNIMDPYPEEINRQLISRIASLHLCPTELNRENLLREGISADIIHVTGNTGLDNIDKKGCVYSNKVLITMHRRDNHGIMDLWFKEFSKLSQKYPELEFILPLHPNPEVQKHKGLLVGVHVIEPLEHGDLIDLLKQVKFVISDSGGLAHEETSYLGKRSIICRKTTERPEILGSFGVLCGDPGELEALVEEINNNHIIAGPCPYGDGDAWKKIAKIFSDIVVYANLYVRKM